MKWIKAIIYGVLAAAISTLSAVAGLQGKHLRDARTQVQEQSRVIDSLLTIRRNCFDIQLNVTDKSTSKVYGSHNRGTITMPSERTYRLEIDSVSVKMR